MVLLRANRFSRCQRKCFSCLILAFMFTACILWTQSYLDDKTNVALEATYSKLRWHEGSVNDAMSDDVLSGSQTCVQPTLPLWTDTIRVGGLYSPCQPVVCNSEDNWVYTSNGRFYISEAAFRSHGHITCAYFPIINDDDDSKVLDKTLPMLNGSLLVSDAFKVFCKASDGAKYVNVHACHAPNITRHGRLARNAGDSSYNIFMFGLDSMSRKAVERFLPRSHEYFNRIMGGVSLEGYNIVGDGTPQALLPILTGKEETSLPEVRRGYRNAQHIDEAAEFIWTKFEKLGYVTSWAEDMAHIATFNYRMLGFKTQPVVHYMRPFYLEAQSALPHFPRFCLGSRPVHKVLLDWIKEGLKTNKGTPFFTFAFFSSYSHNNNDCASLADNDIEEMFKFMKDVNLLDNTFVIFMSDHGLRIGNIRSTEQGKLEERMPYFGIYVPEHFKRKYPYKYNNLVANSKSLTTPFDVHETFLDILGESHSERSPATRQSYSLFAEIPINRTCAGSGIEPHWCVCLASRYVPVTDKVVIETANQFINTINAVVKEGGTLCLELNLKKILKSIQLQTNDKVLKFRKSVDIDGRHADLTDTTKPQTIFYQITLETEPGDGLFELTSSYDVTSGSINIDMKEISRINKYGDAPNCLADKLPALRPYCVCHEI